MKNIFFICLFLSMSLAVSGKKAQVSISCLKTEMLVNPQNIDCPSPRLSWEILSDVRDVRQVSYHILVSTSLEKLNREEGDLWDTGDVASDQSAYISYGGDMLDSRIQCYWKVRVKTNKTRVRDNILKSKEQKNIQPTKGGHKMVTCQNYVSLFYRQITSCPSDGGIS